MGDTMADFLSNECNKLARELDSERATISRAWAVLGSEEDAADDPETADLADAIRVSLEYEREMLAQANERIKALSSALRNVLPLIAERNKNGSLVPFPHASLSNEERALMEPLVCAPFEEGLTALFDDTIKETAGKNQ